MLVASCAHGALSRANDGTGPATLAYASGTRRHQKTSRRAAARWCKDKVSWAGRFKGPRPRASKQHVMLLAHDQAAIVPDPRLAAAYSPSRLVVLCMDDRAEPLTAIFQRNKDEAKTKQRRENEQKKDQLHPPRELCIFLPSHLVVTQQKKNCGKKKERKA